MDEPARDPFSPNGALFTGRHKGHIAEVMPAMDLAYLISADEQVRASFRPSKFRNLPRKLTKGTAVDFEIDDRGHVVDVQLG